MPETKSKIAAKVYALEQSIVKRETLPCGCMVYEFTNGEVQTFACRDHVQVKKPKKK